MIGKQIKAVVWGSPYIIYVTEIHSDRISGHYYVDNDEGRRTKWVNSHEDVSVKAIGGFPFSYLTKLEVI